jgi:Ca2+-binding EF-hand superfamily protein
MGCSNSRINPYQTEPLLQSWKNEFETLGLSEEDISSLFSKLSLNKDVNVKKIPIELIMKRLGQHKKLLRRCFDQADFSGGGFLSFRDFIFAMWYFCTLGDDAMRNYVFDLYDEDGNQKMDYDEYGDMVEGLLGTKISKRGGQDFQE